MLELLDLNGDTNLDLISSDGGLIVRLGDGLGGFGAAQHFGPDAPGAEFSLAVADFDGDTKKDAVDVAGTTLRFWKGVGDGTFLAPVRASSGTSATPRPAATNSSALCIAPPSSATLGSKPAARQAARVTSRSL